MIVAASQPLWMQASATPVSRSAAALLGHIRRIVLRGTCEKMRRVNARRIVAAMANKQPLANSPKRQNERDTMSGHGAAMTRCLTVPPGRLGALPGPALSRIAHVYFFPKRKILPFARESVVAYLRAILGRLVLTGRGFDRNAAVRANPDHRVTIRTMSARISAGLLPPRPSPRASAPRGARAGPGGVAPCFTPPPCDSSAAAPNQRP